MATTLYDRMNKMADRLITKYGYTNAKLVRQKQVGNSWENSFETEKIDVKVIIVPSSKYSKETFRINGKFDISESNFNAFIPHSDFVPTINDQLETDLQTYSIVSVIRVNPNGKDVVYKLELK